MQQWLRLSLNTLWVLTYYATSLFNIETPLLHSWAESLNTTIKKLRCLYTFSTSTSAARFALALHDSKTFPPTKMCGTRLFLRTYLAVVPCVPCWPKNATSDNCRSLIGKGVESLVASQELLLQQPDPSFAIRTPPCPQLLCCVCFQDLLICLILAGK